MSPINLFLASVISCTPASDMGQIGFWESATTSRGGIGSSIELKADGSYKKAIVVLVDLAFDLKEGVLYLAPDVGGPVSYENGVTVKTQKEGYIAVDPEGTEDFRKRIDTSNRPEIYGEYSYRHYTGAIAYEKFARNGTLSLRIPMSLDGGCYTIKDEELHFQNESKLETSTTFGVVSNRLVFKDGNEKLVYKIVPEGAWYEIDAADNESPDS